jgi:hypothetical protein
MSWRPQTQLYLAIRAFTSVRTFHLLLPLFRAIGKVSSVHVRGIVDRPHPLPLQCEASLPRARIQQCATPSHSRYLSLSLVVLAGLGALLLFLPIARVPRCNGFAREHALQSFEPFPLEICFRPFGRRRVPLRAKLRPLFLVL